MRRFRFWMFLLLVGLFCSTKFNSASIANEALRPKMKTIATGLSKMMVAQNYESVTVGTISTPPSLAVSTGVGLKRLLIEEFQLLGVKHKKIGGAVGVKGEVGLGADNKSVELILSLVDRRGTVLADLSQEISGISIDQGSIKENLSDRPGSTAELLGLNIDGSQKGFSNEDLGRSLERPRATLDSDGWFRATANSPFAVKLRVKNRNVRPYIEDGVPFIDLEKGDVFEIDLKNDANYNSAATLLLDGVNSFAVSELRKPDGSPRYSRYVTTPGRFYTLSGWYKNSRELTRFEVTDFGTSVVGQLGGSESVGLITVKFEATWKRGEKLPPGEPDRPVAVIGPLTPGPLAVGEGERIRQRSQADDAPREFGVPRAVISIRYVRS